MFEERSGFRILHSRRWRGHLIEVVEDAHSRALFFDSHLIQSRMILDDPIHLSLPYSQHMMAALSLLNHSPGRVLMIGLGGGSMVKFLLHHFSRCRMEVVELNEGMVSLAERYFHLPRDPRLIIHVADGKRFIDQAGHQAHRYDLILVDAFDREGMARSVYVRSFFEQCRSLMVEGGVTVVNLTRSHRPLFERMEDEVGRCFTDAVVRLPVARSNNEILFACKTPRAWGNWQRVTRRAEVLSGHLGLPMDEHVQRMRVMGGGGWRRFLGLT